MKTTHLITLFGFLVACDEGGNASETGAEAEEPAPFALSSSAFEAEGTIPLPHECGAPIFPNGPGENITPPLSWTDGPSETASYAIVMRDLDFTPDAYPDGLIHWVIYDIPADMLELSEDIDDGAEIDGGLRQGELQNTDFFGYLGPCSPDSVNTYEFTVHAMGEATLPVEAQDEITVTDYVEGNSIAQTSLAGES
ncbi:MAG: YbhB/YbcL family Raf kinase inhibitor-like protein [Myxococcota bacterium]